MWRWPGSSWEDVLPGRPRRNGSIPFIFRGEGRISSGTGFFWGCVTSKHAAPIPLLPHPPPYKPQTTTQGHLWVSRLLLENGEVIRQEGRGGCVWAILKEGGDGQQCARLNLYELIRQAILEQTSKQRSIIVLPPVTAITPASCHTADLTIHIDSSGQKRLVNSQGEQSMIQPLADKFFGDYSRSSSDKVGTHNREAAINSLKRDMQRDYQIPPQSKIFNYAVREIHLLSQLYQGLIAEREKQQIIGEYNRLKDRNRGVKSSFLLYGIFMIGTRRTMWSRLTANRTMQLGLCLFGATLWAKTYLDLGAFQVMSIMRHGNTYENLLQTYEKDYKIVY